jgi:hypothetical protein
MLEILMIYLIDMYVFHSQTGDIWLHGRAMGEERIASRMLLSDAAV